jgi:hypothetical protein
MQVGEWRQDRTGLVKTLAALANTRGGAETESSYSPATAHRTFTLRPSSFFLHIYDIPPILLRIPQFRTFARSSFLNTPFALSFQSSDRLTLSLTIYISRTTNKHTNKHNTYPQSTSPITFSSNLQEVRLILLLACADPVLLDLLTLPPHILSHLHSFSALCGVLFCLDVSFFA